MGDEVHARAHQLAVSVGAVICFPWFTCWPSVRLDLPWRTFTLSWPLQPGVRLLRRLRPLSRTLAFSRLLRARRYERSLISYREVIATLSMPALRRADDGVALIGQRTQQANRRAILARGCQPFPPSVVTTLTQVPLRGQAPFVSIGRRGSPIRPVRLEPADTLSAGFPPQRMPFSDAGRSPLVPLPKYGSSSNSSISEQAHALAHIDAHDLVLTCWGGIRCCDGEPDRAARSAVCSGHTRAWPHRGWTPPGAEPHGASSPDRGRGCAPPASADSPAFPVLSQVIAAQVVGERR